MLQIGYVKCCYFWAMEWFGGQNPTVSKMGAPKY